MVLINYLFCIILSIGNYSKTLVLQWNFVADTYNFKLIFSMANVNFIVDIKLQPKNSLHSAFQTK